MKTLEQLKAELAAVFEKSDVLATAIESEEDKEARKAKVAELKAITSEVADLEASIADKEEEAAILSAHSNSLRPKKSRTLEAGKVNAVDFKAKDNVYDDPKLGFENLGDLALAAHSAAVGNFRDPRLSVIGNNNPELEAAGLRQGNGPDGGFLVPPAFSSEMLMNDAIQSLNLYNMTQNFNIGASESITLPGINQTSRVDGSRWGGTRAYWAAEEATMTESQPQFREITLTPKEHYVYTKASNRLLKVSPLALSPLLSMIAKDEIDFARSDAIINGLGVGKPLGIMQSGALVSVAKETSQTADTFVVENALKMMARLTTRWLAGAVWLVNRDMIPQIATFKVGDTPVYMPVGSAGNSLSVATLFGMPVIVSEYQQVIGDQGDVILTNLKAYVTANNGDVQSDQSIHFNFDVNKTAFRWVTEADGQTWAEDAVTDFIGSGTTSPYVTLDARA